MKATIHISLKPAVLDPQGKAIERALQGLGFDGVSSVRQSKIITLDMAQTDSAAAEKEARAMCEKLLANTVIENYRIELE